MPTYEYVCEKCDHKFDHYQSIKDEPIKTCPQEKCGMKKWGKGKVRRAIGAGAGLIFKGSGFYITDYRSENYKQAAKKESGGESKTESKPSGGETKSTPAPVKSSGSGTASSTGSKSEKKNKTP
ncbi:MAG TPA: FmdB family zinc ribbon protein [Verrucomicrobiae bacterium]